METVAPRIASGKSAPLLLIHGDELHIQPSNMEDLYARAPVSTQTT
jgi:hypothetical protein